MSSDSEHPIPMDDRSSMKHEPGNGKVPEGLPVIVDALTPKELAMIERLASEASDGMRVAEAGELGEPEQVADMVCRLTRLQTARPWVVYREQDDPDKPSVLLAYFGNGPEADANARFFAIARACVLALLTHSNKLASERDKLRGQIDDLSRCILEHHAAEIGRGNPTEGESAIEIAIRLLEPLRVNL